MFNLMTGAAEAKWERAIFKELSKLKGEVVRIAGERLRESKTVDPDSAAEFQSQVNEAIRRWEEELKETVYSLVFLTGEGAVRQITLQFGMSFSVLQPALQHYATRESAFLASVMGETTSRAVVDAVQKSLNEQELLRDMIKRLEQLPAFDRTRAKLVARTETTRAWNGSQRESLSAYQRESGNIVYKTWLSARDQRVRDEHQAMDGEQQPIDMPFSNGLMAPGEPNCRCTLIYSLSQAVASPVPTEAVASPVLTEAVASPRPTGSV